MASGQTVTKGMRNLYSAVSRWIIFGMVGLISPTYAQLNLSVWQDLETV